MLVSHSSGDEQPGWFTSDWYDAVFGRAPQQSPFWTRRYEPRTPMSGRFPKNWNCCPSHAVTLPRGNEPAGVVPSPDRRSARGRDPLLPSLATTGACWHRHTPLAVRATICNVAEVVVQLSAATITNCLTLGCRTDNACAVTRSHCAAGVNITSRIAGRVAVAGAATGAATTDGMATLPANTIIEIAEATTRRSMSKQSTSASQPLLRRCVRCGCRRRRSSVGGGPGDDRRGLMLAQDPAASLDH